MGLKLKDIISHKELQLKDLGGKRIAIDGFNMLYQFLTTIRMQDGSLLTNSKGEVTSHLTGLFSRLVYFLENSINPIIVLDGKPPILKLAERERRKALKEEAQVSYEAAVEAEDTPAMKKFAGRTARLTPEILTSARALIAALGVPLVQAPSEGEAQVAYLVKEKFADFAVSQDYDTLLYETPKLVRNLSLGQKKKKANTLSYKEVTPELIILADVLKELQIDSDQLIIIAILTGTDYNYGGVKGIGQKKALALIKKYNKNYDAIFQEVSWEKSFSIPWQDIYNIIKNMPVEKPEKLEQTPPNKDAVINLLCKKYEFSEERITLQLARLDNIIIKKKQQSLTKFF